MTQTLPQRRALQLFKRDDRRTPYTAGITAHSISQKIDRKARSEAIRAQMLLTARNVAQRAHRVWLACAPWLAAAAIVTFVSLAQVADQQAERIQTLTAERTALIAANSPGASITMRASTVGELAEAARKMAAALDTEAIKAAPKGRP